MKIVVYTAIFGQYDVPRAPVVVEPDVSYYCISEAQWDVPKPYTVMVQDIIDDNPQRTNRYYKLNPHLIFPDADITIYHDGNVELLSNPLDLCNRLGNHNLAIIGHSQRHCLYREAEICKQWKLDRREVIDSQIQRYHSDEMPSGYGLFCGFLLVRRNVPEVVKFNESWWEQVSNGSVRDQISLPYVLWKLGIKHATIPGSIYAGPDYKRHAIHSGGH